MAGKKENIMLSCTTEMAWRISRPVGLLALLLPAACSEAPAPNASPFYLAPSQEPGGTSTSDQAMQRGRGMRQPGDPSSMQNMPAAGSNPSPAGLSSGSGSASFGTGSSGGE